MGKSNQPITILLNKHQAGNEQVVDKIIPIIYEQLKVMAHKYMIKENQDHTLNTTGLVHEAYLRLLGQNTDFQNRSHFYAIVAKTMRRILLEAARSKKANKRGNGASKIPLEDHFIISEMDADQLITIDAALQKLQTLDERLAKVVELRYFGGLNTKEIAAAIDCSESTIKREWRTAKAWLFEYLNGN